MIITWKQISPVLESLQCFYSLYIIYKYLQYLISYLVHIIEGTIMNEFIQEYLEVLL